MADDKRIRMTFKMGRVWVGCEHGRPDDPPHLCFDCYRAAIEHAMARISKAATGEEPVTLSEESRESDEISSFYESEEPTDG